MAFVRGRTSFEERFVDSVVPLPAPPFTAGSLSGPLAWAEASARPDTDCASVLSLAGGAAGAGPCRAPVGSAGGPQGVGVDSASALGAVRDCPDRGPGSMFGGGASNLPDPRCPRDFPVPPLRATGKGAENAAVRSAGRAAPDAADRGRLSAGPGAVNPLAALGVAGAPRLDAEVTAPRLGCGARDGRSEGDHSDAGRGPAELQITYLRPAPWASAGTSREVPASGGLHRGCRSHATQTTRPAREAGL
jgi:hypothetical protein